MNTLAGTNFCSDVHLFPVADHVTATMAEFRNVSRLCYIHDKLKELILYYLYMIMHYNHVFTPVKDVFHSIIYRYNYVKYFMNVAINCKTLKKQLLDCHMGGPAKIKTFSFTMLNTQSMMPSKMF